MAKQKHASKAELLKSLELEKETKRLRALVKNTIYPLLIKGSSSISNAEQMCQVLTMSVQQAFMSQMKTQKLSDLKLREKLQPKVPQADYYLEILDLLSGETVTDATRLIEGVGDEIKRLLKKEQAERKLETLATDFIE